MESNTSKINGKSIADCQAYFLKIGDEELELFNKTLFNEAKSTWDIHDVVDLIEEQKLSSVNAIILIKFIFDLSLLEARELLDL